MANSDQIRPAITRLYTHYQPRGEGTILFKLVPCVVCGKNMVIDGGAPSSSMAPADCERSGLRAGTPAGGRFDKAHHGIVCEICVPRVPKAKRANAAPVPVTASNAPAEPVTRAASEPAGPQDLGNGRLGWPDGAWVQRRLWSAVSLAALGNVGAGEHLPPVEGLIARGKAPAGFVALAQNDGVDGVAVHAGVWARAKGDLTAPLPSTDWSGAGAATSSPPASAPPPPAVAAASPIEQLRALLDSPEFKAAQVEQMRAYADSDDFKGMLEQIAGDVREAITEMRSTFDARLDEFDARMKTLEALGEQARVALNLDAPAPADEPPEPAHKRERKPKVKPA